MRAFPPPLRDVSVVVRRLRGFDDALEPFGPFGPREGGARLVVLVEVLQKKCAKRNALERSTRCDSPCLPRILKKTSMRLVQDACVGV